MSPEDAQRVKDLVIPPAWQDVWICPWPNGHLQAVGTDDAGRRQYLYHPDWRTRRDGEKFQKMLDVRQGAVQGPRAGAGRPRRRGDDAGARLRGRRTAARPRATSGSATTSTPRRTAASGSPPSSGGTSGARARRWSSTSSASPGSSTVITIDDPGAVEALEVMRKRRGRRRPAARVEGRPDAGGRWTPSLVNEYVGRTTGHGGHGQGLPHLARDRDRGGLAGVRRVSRRPRPRASGRSSRR